MLLPSLHPKRVNDDGPGVRLKTVPIVGGYLSAALDAIMNLAMINITGGFKTPFYFLRFVELCRTNR